MSKYTNLFVLAFLFFFACQEKINQPTELLSYNGKIVTETVAPFLGGGDGSLYRTVAPTGQIEHAPPYGTVYGHESDPNNVYLSRGEERLPSGSWTDQVNNETYTTTLFNDGTITFENLTVVTISNAVNTHYLNENGDWINIESDITLQAKAVTTGSNGVCDISTGDRGVLMAGGGGGIN